MKNRKRNLKTIILLAIIAVGGIVLYQIYYMSILHTESKAKQYYDPEECKIHNDSVEKSPYFKKILPEVTKEVYRAYTMEQIKDAEEHIKRMGEDSTSAIYYHDDIEKIKKAKSLLKESPEKAAELYYRMGSCNTLLQIKKTILKEKYGIIWYTPSELNPNGQYD